MAKPRRLPVRRTGRHKKTYSEKQLTGHMKRLRKRLFKGPK
jgi:hypothetical protein